MAEGGKPEADDPDDWRDVLREIGWQGDYSEKPAPEILETARRLRDCGQEISATYLSIGTKIEVDGKEFTLGKALMTIQKAERVRG